MLRSRNRCRLSAEPSSSCVSGGIGWTQQVFSFWSPWLNDGVTGTPLRAQIYAAGKASVDMRAGFDIGQGGALMRIDDPSGVLAHP